MRRGEAVAERGAEYHRRRNPVVHCLTGRFLASHRDCRERIEPTAHRRDPEPRRADPRRGVLGQASYFELIWLSGAVTDDDMDVIYSCALDIRRAPISEIAWDERCKRHMGEVQGKMRTFSGIDKDHEAAATLSEALNDCFFGEKEIEHDLLYRYDR